MVAGLTRRALLARGAVAGAGLVLAGCGTEALVRSSASLDLRPLEATLRSELDSAAALAGLTRTLGGPAGRLVARIEVAERRHADALRGVLRELGGGDLLGRDAPRPRLDGLAGALAAKDRSAADYLDLLPRLRVPAVREVVGFILAEEVAHAAALRDALGREPVTGAFL